ncbi:MAG: DUF4126 domain-containing protein [Verrucomicrobiota bacterium]
MDEATAIFAGIGLAAACGFRVFAPLFIASLAANSEVDFFNHLDVAAMLGADFEWLGSPMVTLALGVATALEVASYYIPWVDNLLDSVATPAAILAGTFISGAFMPELLGDGALKWILAAIAGGGSAGIIQGASVLTRGASTATTGGMGNPAVSTAELGGSVATASLAMFVPIIAGILALLLVAFFLRTLIRLWQRRRHPTDRV